MPYKRKPVKIVKKRVYKKKANTTVSTLRAIVKKELNKNIETKKSCFSNTDYQQIGHNSFIIIDDAPLKTTQGTDDPEAAETLNRIGDEVNLKGVAISMMLELNERYSDVTYRIIVVKASKGDTPTSATLFNGLSGNKMMDTFNKERFSIIYEKWGKITAPNQSAGRQAFEDVSTLQPSTGIYAAVQTTISRATRIVKFYLPYNKFQRSSKIIYENNLGQPKNFSYYVIVFAYSNFATSSALGYNVLAINDYVKVMYYKDA